MRYKLNSPSAFFILAALFTLAVTPPANAAVVDLPDGSKADLSSICPVCGMKVEAGSLGPAAVVLSDRSVKVLDGPGDFFRFILSPASYGFENTDLKQVFVTDYAAKKFIDAKKAYYVVGSSLSGGMGPEAVPFSTMEAADKFKRDNGGKAVLSYGEVAMEHLKPRKKILKMERGAPSGTGHSH